MRQQSLKGELWGECGDVRPHFAIDLSDGFFAISVVEGMDAKIGLK
jgi:hypothetical protein